MVSLRRLSGVLEYLLDDSVGVIRGVVEVPRQAGTPDFFHFAATAGNTQAFCPMPNFASGGGASAVRDVAVAKAVGEAVERYCAALYEMDDLPLTSRRAAAFECAAPAEFALYSPEQYAQPDFPWQAFDDDTPVRWARAFDPKFDAECRVPAAMIFLPYMYYTATGDTPIVQPISTGLACHCSPAEAVVAAICEVIERDAFTITWQCRLGAPQLLIETLSDANYEMVRRFERTAASVVLLDITTDVDVPTVLAVLRNESPAAPALVVAAAADLDPEQAVRKSLEELAHTARYSQQIATGLPRLTPDPCYSNVVDQVSHLNFWVDRRHIHLADFLVASPIRIPFGELASRTSGNAQRDLAFLLDQVEQTGHRVLLADLTTPDIRELGLTVIRAVIPGFHPLFMGHRLRALGGRRLWETPQKLGYPGITGADGDNPAPHPYP